MLHHLFGKHTILEIKSVAESFTVPKFQKLLGYSHLYLWKEELSEDDIASVALVTHVPEQLLALKRWKRLGKGFYQRKPGFFVSLVAVNELPIRREYYPLLLLASGKQRERFLQAILQEGDVYYLQYALLANRKEVRKMSEELGLSLPDSLEENLRHLIEEGIFNPQKVAQELVAGAGVQPIVDAVGVERLLQFLLPKVDRQTLHRLLECQEAQNSPNSIEA
ncbi:hypothetical protein FJZ31_16770 [Candidatus Poribacteria bacterium]|nr:hypothetical protein [Candidatus Poribacteria bacterium]